MLLTLGVVEVDHRPIVLEEVNLLDSRDVVHPQTLQSILQPLIVGGGGLVDGLLLTPHRTLAPRPHLRRHLCQLFRIHGRRILRSHAAHRKTREFRNGLVRVRSAREASVEVQAGQQPPPTQAIPRPAAQARVQAGGVAREKARLQLRVARGVSALQPLVGRAL